MYTYETLGGNNSRTALTELCSEREDLAADERYVKENGQCLCEPDQMRKRST